MVTALAATGKRSLSSYLTQSVVFAPVLCGWGLGLGATMSATTGTGFAIATWLLTVLLSSLAERTGRRGPAEAVLRRLTYGRRVTGA